MWIKVCIDVIFSYTHDTWTIFFQSIFILQSIIEPIRFFLSFSSAQRVWSDLPSFHSHLFLFAQKSNLMLSDWNIRFQKRERKNEGRSTQKKKIECIKPEGHSCYITCFFSLFRLNSFISSCYWCTFFSLFFFNQF
jgi:hypothetical protein